MRASRRSFRAAWSAVGFLALAGACLAFGEGWAALVALAAALCLAWMMRSTPQDAPPPQPVDSGGEPHSAEALVEALNALPDPVLVIEAEANAQDDVGRRWVRHANPAAVELMRIGQNDAILTTAVREPDVLQAIEEALFGGEAQTIIYETGGAHERYWQAWTAPLAAGPAGEPRAVLRLRDETDARRVEMMRVDFLANASHELRTPLASLGGFIETLKGHARDDVRARDRFLDIMATQTDRMGRLVADLLALSRIELNEHIPPSGEVDLASVVAEVVAASGPLSAEKDVSLVIGGDTGRILATGDRDQLIQVIQNLIDNAVKYSPGGATVRIDLVSDLDGGSAAVWRATGGGRASLLTPDPHPGARYGLISVRDAGPGMARAQLPRLTERFFRVEGQKSGDRLGTGLGLAIVKHIVNRHRGGMAVESTVGEGSVFSVYFPMIRQNDDESPTV